MKGGSNMIPIEKIFPFFRGVKRERVRKVIRSWVLAALPVVAVLLIAFLYPRIFGRDYMRQECYPVNGKPDKTREGTMTVRFLDVGQADAALISLPDGRFLMIDAGAVDSGNQVCALLSAYGVREIDTVFLSHSHEDHIGGLTSVLGSFPVTNVVLNDTDPGEIVLTSVLSEAEAHGTEVFSLEDGSVCHFGDVTVTVILPPEGMTGNNASSLFIVRYGEDTVLFTGDAEVEEETALLARCLPLLDADVVKLGHHGSFSSSSEKFLDAVSPFFAVISCGSDNDYGHPDGTVLNRCASLGIPVFRTDTDGTVVFLTDGNGFY